AASSDASGKTAAQMEKTVTGLEALVKQYEALIKKLEGQVKDAESGSVAGGQTGTVDVSTRLNIRTGPWGKIIGKLSNADSVQIVAKEGDWFKIRNGDGFAYIHSYYVNAPGHPSHQGVEPPVLGSNQSPSSSSSSSSSGSSSSGSTPAATGGKGFGGAPCSPMPSRTSSEYGPRDLFGHSFHSGIDLPVPTGTRLNSLGEGTVVSTGYESGGGRFVKVKYTNGYTSFYCHLQSVSVKQGQKVGAGQEIARSDNTGQWTTGAHLHLAMYNSSGTAVNPRSVSGIKFPPK
ncbi:MAG TPA: peptidoglycan DD-metalloendopeptidase family protein, partial [Candidatus Ozemobacteraceae bacterium]|nr:peptidoglycan DD-metalloendopeptidase family protein [Candidatus Ozemobacteraceae bacterium]